MDSDAQSALAALEKQAPGFAKIFWSIQGRLNALSLIATQFTLDRAAVNEDPGAWIQQLVANMRTSLRTLKTDPADASHDAQLKAATVRAAEDWCEQLLMHAPSPKKR